MRRRCCSLRTSTWSTRSRCWSATAITTWSSTTTSRRASALLHQAQTLGFTQGVVIPILLLMQGTAATALAGLYGALAVQGKPVQAIKDQRIVVVGAGSAGMGVVGMIAAGVPVLFDMC